ncbi:Putative enoyl-CoA hydratase/isomerase, ClpP/crotonase-like domain superfamily [Septoria linicola]|uniref:Enoyl-CoA hydratase domain-containing protein 3, mitochondrial n=1 Tax=Septoria linicola TaxID=215465 RepID=A0A9Q9ALN9_9PEZI|nr:putative enoyl-CoA hydratase/isomerase, ClpP/crotonase-like domain superfamily [Septoria linicola]USW51275.1 Putative enoyl-CoA hydratase/isomerase, ClpP/crotonase-like domain superfamily [Septoria linicola]
MSWPRLPTKAAYLALQNGKRRNALSLSVLRDLREQLTKYNTSPVDGRVRILPAFQPAVLNDLEAVSAGSASEDTKAKHAWLVDGATWRKEREGLPSVIVLRSEGPVFSSGHDLGELRTLSHDGVKETFALCAEVMSLIRRSPAPVVGVVQGLATAAGCQLALTTDIPIAAGSTQFRLPGASIGLSMYFPFDCEPVRANELPGGAVDVVADAEALEKRVEEVITKLSQYSGAQSQALGKWAYWTQLGLRGGDSGGDGYEEAVSWAGRMMALHARSDDAKEGISAFFEKRKPSFST